MRSVTGADRITQATQQNMEAVKAAPNKPKVLLFDEDIDDLAWYAASFQSCGLEVCKCISLERAMRCIEREEFDFAMVDHGTGAFGWLQLIRHLARHNPHTPFAVVARCDKLSCCRQAFALGAVDYLLKPIPTQEVNWIVRRYLRSDSAKQIDSGASGT